MTDPIECHQTDRVSIKTAISGSRNDIPLRAKSVCLIERTQSKYVRAVQSAESIRSIFPNKQYIHRKSLNTDVIRRRPNKTPVKPQNRKVVEKIPLAVSIQTLTIPMKYADNPKPRHSTSKPSQNLFNSKRVDSNKTKHYNPHKQGSNNKRLCQTIACGKETQNQLLLQIREAEQVSDFERILNTNTIFCDRTKRQLWRCFNATHKTSSSVVPRPRSTYSLYAVSQAYHYLFHQHEESLQPLINEYRQTNFEKQTVCPPASLLGHNWYDNLQDLSEFYEDDKVLKKEIDSITDRLIAEEVKASKEPQVIPDKRINNFNVNLADLIGLHVDGESCTHNRDVLGLSPDVDRKEESNKEWLSPIMSANIDNQLNSQNEVNVECITQSFESVKIESDNHVPAITFSNCCDSFIKNDLPKTTNVVIHLTVPSVDIIDESRPPMT